MDRALPFIFIILVLLCGAIPARAAEGKISSHVDRTFPLAQTADALKVLAGRKAMGKVILHP